MQKKTKIAIIGSWTIKTNTDLSRITLSLLLIAAFYTANAQVDTLYYKRVLFDTPVFLNSEKLSTKKVSELYKLDKVASRKYKIGRIMLPVSPVLAATGTVLAVNALTGINRTAIIDGVPYDYTERSLPKLLVGLALFVTGGSLMEGSNDFKRTAAERYNTALKKATDTPKTSYHPTYGITEAGNVGFRLEF